ncbi:MAG TPA: hypothetical protein VNF27_08855 [Candidatus Binataceae bacterium]|nr:hypothetical protein [Candidatus Binataceae bacterium]
MNRPIMRVTAAAGLILALAARGAFAQTMMQVPVPEAGQNAPRFTPRSQATAATHPQPGGDTLQLAPAPTPVAAAPMPAPVPIPAPQAAAPPPPVSPPPAMMTQTAPVLPAVFRGCWQGEVNLLDTLERLPGAHKVGYWTPKTYRLCYKRIGNGPFKLTFSETGIAPTDKIIHARGHVDTLATDGRVYARLRSQLGFDEFRVEPGGSGATFHVDETTMLDCKIENGAMAVAASVYGTRDGAPWFRARWRALFRPVAR